MQPALGPLTDRLARLLPVDDPANSGGSSYFSGWYGYVVKSLTGGFPSVGRFCGEADGCRAAVWKAIDEAGQELRAAQGTEPAGWAADATRARITFGFLSKTARWTNRPTFQQAIWFNGHRPR